MNKAYHVHEFAALTGVTIRALHHYDRLGRLHPHRTGSGYRVYRRQELERLEQIVALKFFGLSLRQIKAILDHSSYNLRDVLGVQRIVLEEKRLLLDCAIQSIHEAEQSCDQGGQPNAEILKRIIEAIEMQTRNTWIEKYYSPDAWTGIKQMHPEWSPTVQGNAYQEWLDLFRDVEAAFGEHPQSEGAQILAQRWKTLEMTFTCGGDPEIAKGLNRMFADKPNWPDAMREKMAPFQKPAVWEFMRGRLETKAGQVDIRKWSGDEGHDSFLYSRWRQDPQGS